jgi:APA family basic amino acid/polyamine antiporter
MATAARPGLFARKPTDVLVREASGDSEHGLKRSVGVLDLTALGIGAVIGTGIFVIGRTQSRLQRGEGALEPAPGAGPA